MSGVNDLSGVVARNLSGFEVKDATTSELLVLGLVSDGRPILISGNVQEAIG
jgi:hypothetical protein